MKNNTKISISAPFREALTVAVSSDPASTDVLMPPQQHQEEQTSAAATAWGGAASSMSYTQNLLQLSMLQTWSSLPPFFTCSRSAASQQQQQSSSSPREGNAVAYSAVPSFASSFTGGSFSRCSPRLLVPIKKGSASFALESICCDAEQLVTLRQQQQQEQSLAGSGSQGFSFRVTFYAQTTPGKSTPIALCTLDPFSPSGSLVSHHFSGSELSFSSNVLIFALVRRKFVVPAQKQQQQQQQHRVRRGRDAPTVADGEDELNEAFAQQQKECAMSQQQQQVVFALKFFVCGTYYAHVPARDCGRFENRHALSESGVVMANMAAAGITATQAAALSASRGGKTMDRHFLCETRNDLLPVFDRVFGNESTARLAPTSNDFGRRSGDESSVSSSSSSSSSFSASASAVSSNTTHSSGSGVQRGQQMFQDRHFSPLRVAAPGANAVHGGAEDDDQFTGASSSQSPHARRQQRRRQRRAHGDDDSISRSGSDEGGGGSTQSSYDGSSNSSLASPYGLRNMDADDLFDEDEEDEDEEDDYDEEFEDEEVDGDGTYGWEDSADDDSSGGYDDELSYDDDEEGDTIYSVEYEEEDDDDDDNDDYDESDYDGYGSTGGQQHHHQQQDLSQMRGVYRPTLHRAKNGLPLPPSASAHQQDDYHQHDHYDQYNNGSSSSSDEFDDEEFEEDGFSDDFLFDDDEEEEFDSEDF